MGRIIGKNILKGKENTETKIGKGLKGRKKYYWAIFEIKLKILSVSGYKMALKTDKDLEQMRKTYTE